MDVSFNLPMAKSRHIGIALKQCSENELLLLLLADWCRDKSTCKVNSYVPLPELCSFVPVKMPQLKQQL